MALVSLKNGKVIDVDILWYLSLSDEEIQDLEALDVGFDPENPFYNSSLTKPSQIIIEENEEEQDIIEPYDEDLPTDET